MAKAEQTIRLFVVCATAAWAASALPAAAQQLSPRELRQLQLACADDAQIHCAGAPRDPQARIACLRDKAPVLSPRCRQALGALAASMPGGGGAPPAAAPAAPPSAAQQSAIRNDCRGDAQSLCPGMQGQQAFTCLQQNAARLSPACRQAVSGVSPPAAAPAPAAPRAPAPPRPATPAPAAAPAPAQPSAEQQAAMRANCRGDAQSLCPGMQGQPAFACLQQNAARLSAACRTAVVGPGASPAAPAAAAPATASPPTSAAPAPAAAAPAASGEAEQMATLGRACGADIQTHCKGVSLGTGRIMACLAANGAALSATCRQALADVSRGR